MRRMTMLVPVVMAAVLGAVAGGRMLPAEAQQGPPASCEATLAKRDVALKKARRSVTHAEARATAAEADAKEARLRVSELERMLELERERVKRLERHLGLPIIDHF